MITQTEQHTSDDSKIEIGRQSLKKLIQTIISLINGLKAKAKNTGNMDAAYQISNAATQLTSLETLKTQIIWLQQCGTVGFRMLGDINLSTDPTINIETLELYDLNRE